MKHKQPISEVRRIRTGSWFGIVGSENIMKDVVLVMRIDDLRRGLVRMGAQYEGMGRGSEKYICQDIAVCLIKTEEGVIPLLLEPDFLAYIGGRSIYLEKGVGMRKARVNLPGGKKYVHTLPFGEMLSRPNNGQVDHKNLNRLDCTKGNLRVCESLQNQRNKRERLARLEQDGQGRHFFRGAIRCDDGTFQELLGRGYKSMEYRSDSGSGWRYVESPHYDNGVECCRESRKFDRIRYGEFAYIPEEDFSDDMDDFKNGVIGGGTELLIRNKVFHEITDGEMVGENRKRLGDVRYGNRPLKDYML